MALHTTFPSCELCFREVGHHLDCGDTHVEFGIAVLPVPRHFLKPGACDEALSTPHRLSSPSVDALIQLDRQLPGARQGLATPEADGSRQRPVS